AYTRSLVQAIPRLATGQRRRVDPSGSPLLRVDQVSFGYTAPGLFRTKPGPLALRDISLDLHAGETLGIVGESGSGKSTLASLISGEVAGHSGEITLDDAPLAGLAKTRSKGQRQRVQMVFQDTLSSLNPTHNVENILTRPLRICFGQSAAEARENAVALLAEMDLGPEFLARYPRQMSGGQQQRIALARALAAKPDVLLCDEITSALDLTTQAQVIALLQRLQAQRGLGILFITHDLALVSQVAQRLLVLEQGERRERGETAAILTNPQSPYTAALLAAYSAQTAKDGDRVGATGALEAAI
ncbi:MAG TPA: ABC transporter ATP-binding protein, partial [Aliiroseovarius sp.]|nr:ABC transporter ATP-binding protein [Aliiroseovarius sp.]